MPSWCVLGGRCSALESRSLAPRVRRALVPSAGRAIERAGQGAESARPPTAAHGTTTASAI
jgi:hypothetical protein